MNSEYTSTHNYEGSIELDEFREMVAKNAYYRAEKRGFKTGFEVDDWLKAEREISNQRRYWLR
jgi:hypothetical protein